MNLVLLTVLAAAALAGALTGSGPVAAQLPGTPCTAANLGQTTMRTVWDENANSWAVYEFQCATKGDGNYRWRGGPVRWLHTPDKPDGWRFDGFDERGHFRIRAVTSPSRATRLERASYWDVEVSNRIRQEIARYAYAADICAAVTAPDAFVKGVSIDTDHIYRIDQAWHYIPDADHRETLGLPDARMSSIWGYRTEFQDHDNDPSTPQQGVRVPAIASCASE